MAHARDTRLPASLRVDNLIFNAYQSMRTTALVLLADYVDCDTLCRELDGPIRGLRMPHWGEWVTLASKLSAFWLGQLTPQPSRECRVPALVEGWRSVASLGRRAHLDPRWVPLLAMFEGKHSCASDAMQKTRNDRAHRLETHTVDTSRDERDRARLEPLVEEVVRTLFPRGGFELLRRVPGDGPLRVWRLHGAPEGLRFEARETDEDLTQAFLPSGIVTLVAGVAVPLFPLFAPSREEGGEVPGGGLTEPAALVDGIKEKSVVLLGVRGYENSTALIEPTRAALARKQMDLRLSASDASPVTIADWARTSSREAVDALHGRKYFPAAYVVRRGVDDVVDLLMERGGKGLLLLGEAGSGKSSLLARFVDRETAPELVAATLSDRDRRGPDKGRLAAESVLADRGQGDVVLFLSGRADYGHDRRASADQLLCDAVLRKAGVREGAFPSLEKLAATLDAGARRDSRARPVLIVLDALNEADRFTELMGALDAFLPSVARHPWLRLPVSLRAGAYHALERRGESMQQAGGVFANEQFLSEHADKDGKLHPYLDLRPFQVEPEGREAYEKRAEALPTRACTSVWSQLRPEVHKLLASPLHLHLFHDAFAGRGAPSDSLGERTLFAQYMGQLVQEVPGLEETLRWLGGWMYEQRRPDLPLAVADERLEAWRKGLGGVEAMARLDPMEALVAASLLLRPAEAGFGADRALVGFQFAHQRLCEEVLARDLGRQMGPKTLPDGEVARLGTACSGPGAGRARRLRRAGRCAGGRGTAACGGWVPTKLLQVVSPRQEALPLRFPRPQMPCIRTPPDSRTPYN